jgi:hypothetical protein
MIQLSSLGEADFVILQVADFALFYTELLLFTEFYGGVLKEGRV